MRRASDRSETSTHDRGSSRSDALRAARTTWDDGAWLGSGMVLTCGGFLPSLALCACAQQVRSLFTVFHLFSDCPHKTVSSILPRLQLYENDLLG